MTSYKIEKKCKSCKGTGKARNLVHWRTLTNEQREQEIEKDKQKRGRIRRFLFRRGGLWDFVYVNGNCYSCNGTGISDTYLVEEERGNNYQ